VAESAAQRFVPVRHPAHQVDFQSCSQSEEVAPRVTVALGKLIDQLLNAE
jgi:hypothetical protein